MNDPHDQFLWDELFKVDRDCCRHAMTLWSQIKDKLRVLEDGLAVHHQRRTALRMLLSLDDETKRAIFPTLVDLASVGHSDVDLCRTVIFSMPRRWVVENIEPHIHAVLAKADVAEVDEEFRRFAELLLELDLNLLKRLLETARQHPNSHVREVAEYFTTFVVE